MSRRPRIRFSTQSLLLFMFLLCVVLAWRVERARKQRALVTWVHQMGGRTEYRNPTGTDFFDDVVGVAIETPHVGDVSPLAKSTSLERLVLDGTRVDDLAPLAGLRDLTHLYVVSFRLACMTDFAGPSGVVSGRPGAVIT